MARQQHQFGIGLVVLLVFGLDFLTKEIARSQLQLQTSQPFIPGFLKLTLATNSGAAFSLGSSNGFLMTLIAAVITGFLIYWTFILQRGSFSRQEAIAMGFLIGGACGNLLERIIRGRVTDFFDFAFMSFPIFNVADICIDIGIALLLLSRMRNTPSSETNKPTSN